MSVIYSLIHTEQGFLQLMFHLQPGINRVSDIKRVGKSLRYLLGSRNRHKVEGVSLIHDNSKFLSSHLQKYTLLPFPSMVII